MNPSPVCPRCGSVLSDGHCSVCGGSSTPLSESSGQPGRSKALRIWLIIGAVYLTGSIALVVYFSHLEMQKAKEREAWNHAHPSNSRPVGRITSASHDGPVARVDELKGSGRIYLVQMGEHKAPYSLNDFAQWLRSKYELDVQVLQPINLPHDAWDSERKQYVAELLCEQIKREHPDLAADPKALFFGVTDFDIYSVSKRMSFSIAMRYESRFAIISNHRGMIWFNWEREKGDAEASRQEFEARLRRIFLRNVALLYWHLPLNNDSTSLLQDYVDPATPVDDIYESDLDPARTSTGEYLNGPGISFTYSAKDGIKPLPGASIQESHDNPNLSTHDESREVFEVYLAAGLLVDRHTDFNLPDTIPIQFERTTRDGWGGSHPFGISGTDNYDDFLYSNDNIRDYIAHADGNRDELLRVPIWMPFQSFAKYVDTGYSGKYYEMHWRTFPFGHYDLKRYDGEVKTFLPCSDSKFPCYLTGLRNGQGQELKFNRDATRRLTQLTSPNRSWLRLSYGPGNHIAEIDDSRGRTVRYGYDGNHRLTTVTYPTGEVYHYEYDNTQHLLTFSVAPDAKTEPRVMLRNEYEDGRVVKQTLDDGTAYTYKFSVSSSGSVIGVDVRTPDGRVFNIEISDGYSTSTVRELTPQPNAQQGRPASR